MFWVKLLRRFCQHNLHGMRKLKKILFWR